MNRSVKFTKFLLYIVLFITIFTYKSFYCYAEEIIEEVDSKKEWTIKFNQLIDPNCVLSKNILVKDSNNNVVFGIYSILLNDGQTVKVKSSYEEYKPNEIYTLILKENIRSLKGKTLGKIKIKKFKIKKSKDYKKKTPIIGKEELSVKQMAQYVLKHNQNPKVSVNIHKLANIFLQEGAIEGVRGDIAFCQSIKETGFFRYGGQVLADQNNYAGIGAVNNSPIGKGSWFKDVREGVRAQIQHLKAYSSKESLKNYCVDPRYSILEKIGKLGVAPNWEDLNGKWAVPGKNYGEEIMNIYRKIKQL